MPRTLLGWLALAIVLVVIWKDPHATGHFLFTTVPAKVSAFFAGI
jgi:hypothetical protein